MAKSKTAEKTDENNRTLAQNRRARHDYDILETYEAGLVLVGAEVKSLREGSVQIREAFARVDEGEAWLYQLHISPYKNAHGFGAHETDRKRKLLMHAREIEDIARAINADGKTLIPMALVMREGKVKVVLGIAKGRKTADKRHAIAERDAARDVDREFSRRTKGQ